ncbi:uncharacterized protein V1516DRAFT_670717 [Lipomyces oligophaga]|uniref:uncharacterized protein n=1 Tax=Lipomyces oligophaga TaxID=45792 RepID=UPI0034CEF79D
MVRVEKDNSVTREKNMNRLFIKLPEIRGMKWAIGVQWARGSGLQKGGRKYGMKSDSLPRYYEIFQDVLPQGPPPKGEFKVDSNRLRREFLKMQSAVHPDKVQGDEEKKQRAEELSSELNKAYSVLRSPLLRAVYLLECHGMTVGEDAGRTMQQDPALLMEVYEILEAAEECESDEEVEVIAKDINSRISQSEKNIEQAFNSDDLMRAQKETILLRYWINVSNALKEWEPGKPLRMVH